MVGWFIFLSSLYDGIILGSLSLFCIQIVVWASFLLPIVTVVYYLSIITLIKILENGSPQSDFIGEELKNVGVHKIYEEDNKNWFHTFYDNHIVTIFKTLFIILTYMNGYYISAFLICCAFIISEINTIKLNILFQKINA
jgi:hypothetical protein